MRWWELLNFQMIAILISLIFYNQKLNQEGVMNLNGAIFLFLTNMTFQNVFSIINVSSLRHPLSLPSIFFYLLIETIQGFLRWAPGIFARETQSSVQYEHIFLGKNLGRIAIVPVHSDALHLHYLSIDWTAHGVVGIFHCHGIDYIGGKCVGIIW